MQANTSEVIGERIIACAGDLAFHKRCVHCGKHRWLGFWTRQIVYRDYKDSATTKEVRYFCEGTGCEWDHLREEAQEEHETL